MTQYVLYDSNIERIRQFIDTKRWNYHSEILSDSNLISLFQFVKFIFFNNKEV